MYHTRHSFDARNGGKNRAKKLFTASRNECECVWIPWIEFDIWSKIHRLYVCNIFTRYSISECNTIQGHNYEYRYHSSDFNWFCVRVCACTRVLRYTCTAAVFCVLFICFANIFFFTNATTPEHCSTKAERRIGEYSCNILDILHYARRLLMYAIESNIVCYVFCYIVYLTPFNWLGMQSIEHRVSRLFVFWPVS